MVIVLWNLFLQIVSGILGLFLAQKYVPGVEFTGPLFVFPRRFDDLNAFFDTLFFAGTLLGFLNYFVKPLLKTFTLPLRIITFNLFSIIIAMFIVWLVKIFSPNLNIQGIKPLFLVTIIVWALNFILIRLFPEKPKFQASSS
jgi:putative membrane protein